MTADTVKHTRGPWLVRPHWSDESRFEVYPDREVGFGSPAEIADVCSHSSEDFDKEVAEAKANANLIAAAPDLLDAANKTVDGLAEEYLITAECDDDWIYDTLGSVLAGAYFSARAAIAKAEGRS